MGNGCKMITVLESKGGRHILTFHVDLPTIRVILLSFGCLKPAIDFVLDPK